MPTIALVCLVFAMAMFVGFGLWLIWLHFQ